MKKRYLVYSPAGVACSDFEAEGRAESFLRHVDEEKTHVTNTSMFLFAIQTLVAEKRYPDVKVYVKTDLMSRYLEINQYGEIVGDFRDYNIKQMFIYRKLEAQSSRFRG